ncbi:nucleotide pyrophosphohydrolase [Liberiplasma polymorphum]|uniref:nucleotide pyrophosphohydrolase n=1 Tax=Liberiplasma polymorphum TaxID=3374570 RepID=UPI00377533B6
MKRNINEIADMIIEYRNSQGWQVNDTPNALSKSILIEAIELLINFKDDCKNVHIENVKEELADILMYTLTMSSDLNINIKNEILRSLAKKYNIKME